MKEKITDLFDDIPVELLDEIEVQKGNGHGRKKGIYIPKWAAVLVIGLLCLFAGTAGYAAIKHPDLSYNHHFKWWFSLSPPKGYCYCSPRRAVSQALLLVRYKAAPLESSFLESSACSLIYFCTASSVILPIVST
ncbi:hypothetical protein CE91St59_19400 [[Clostridium] scindens]|uniref:Uncharacterized protein n=1 Tax=Clostridium scindens (strain ATCC 35704 / DSM 5676 / VPI 13733 / 19) TaxID=411468 RepID=A0A494WQ44_CLOS5|nr:hypothetical protein HDCHBGLK_03150 [[Clostridium] scindens ATCC 35704]BDF16677.1 hypothetical protein CE91St59_19400 [[Clostridium] scindens]BDF20376.1 hypothetical protein CE91St60_19590 [[Clostridium] scindens]